MREIIVWILLLDNNNIFLLKSHNEWALIGGHVENNESIKQALVREIKEEVGIEVKEKDLYFQCVIDRKLNNKNEFKTHFFFKTVVWQGKPYNKEEDVHSQGKWHNLNNLPADLGPLAGIAIQSLNKDKQFYEYTDD